MQSTDLYWQSFFAGSMLLHYSSIPRLSICCHYLITGRWCWMVVRVSMKVSWTDCLSLFLLLWVDGPRCLVSGSSAVKNSAVLGLWLRHRTRVECHYCPVCFAVGPLCFSVFRFSVDKNKTKTMKCLLTKIKKSPLFIKTNFRLLSINWSFRCNLFIKDSRVSMLKIMFSMFFSRIATRNYLLKIFSLRTLGHFEILRRRKNETVNN